MKRVLTADAIQFCERRGRHSFAWVPTWGDVGYHECTVCGLAKAPGPRTELQPAEQPTAAELAAVTTAAAAAPRRSPRAVGRTWTDNVTGRVFDMRGRDLEIERLRRSGLQLGAIGLRFGITNQRVSQICKAARIAQ